MTHLTHLGHRGLSPSGNGSTTVELVFLALHPSILLLERGRGTVGDPYDEMLGGLAGGMRQLAKAAFQPAVNAACMASAVAAVSASTGRNRQWAAAAVEAVRSYCGLDDGEWSLWRRLQHQDGELAVAVCLRMARQGVPCLPVHDSFIVPFAAREALRAAMMAEFKARWGAEPRVR